MGNPRRLIPVLGLAAAALLAMGQTQCSNVNLNLGDVRTATGEERYAAQLVVSTVYQGGPLTNLDPLSFGGPDVNNPVQAMQARLPQLSALMEKGVTGLMQNGYVQLIRPEGLTGAQLAQAKALVRAENTDRHTLYEAATAGVGQGAYFNDGEGWAGVTNSDFGLQWIAQAPKGWWVQDNNGQWYQKLTQDDYRKPPPQGLL